MAGTTTRQQLCTKSFGSWSPPPPFPASPSPFHPHLQAAAAPIIHHFAAGRHLPAPQLLRLLLRGALEGDGGQLLAEELEPLLTDLARHQVCRGDGGGGGYSMVEAEGEEGIHYW